VPPPPPVEPEKVPPPPPAEPEDVPSPLPEEVPPPPPAEVKPPPPEEVKPQRRKVARQPVAAVHAPAVNVQDASWSGEVAPPGFRESWKGGRSSRGPTTQSSAADDNDGLRLQDQCLGWGAGERSAPPIYDDNDGGLDVSGSGSDSSSGSDSDSDGGAPPAATTSA
jgi:hypothetical protein